MSATHNGVRSTYSKSSGKWYWEITIDSGTTHFVGVATGNANLDTYAGGDAYSWGYHDLDGEKYSNGGGVAFGDTYVAGDVIGVALDLENNKVWFSKNGVWQDDGVPTDGTDAAYSNFNQGLENPNAPIFPIWSGYDAGEVTANFGDSAFAYDVPTDFNPLSSGASTISWDEDTLGSEVLLLNEDLRVYTHASVADGQVIHLGSTIATEGKTSGKWYWEISVFKSAAINAGDTPDVYQGTEVGVILSSLNVEERIGNNAAGFAYGKDGEIRNSGSSNPYGDAYDNGDIVSIALDLDNNKIWFAVNGVWQDDGDPEEGTNKAFALTDGLKYHPAATAAGFAYALWTDGVLGSFAHSNVSLDLNVGATDFSYTPPTGFKAYNATSQTLEVELTETITTEDSYSREVEYGGDPPADHYGETSENVTTADYFYAELPGDTEDPGSGHAGESFTTSASITVESTNQELDEDVELSAEIIGQSPYDTLAETTTLSDAISAIFDPVFGELDEDITTADLIEAPIYGDLDEDVTTAEAISRFIEAPLKLEETTTISEEITGSITKLITVTETIGFNDQLGWGWFKSIQESLVLTDTNAKILGIPVNESLTLQETLAANWDGTEEVTSALALVGQVIVAELFNDTVTESLVLTDTQSHIHQMISAISESLVLADTSIAGATFNPLITEAIAVTGIVEVLSTLNNSNTESLALTDSLGVGWDKTLNESLVLTDTLTLLKVCMLILTDSLVLTDTALGLFEFSDTVTEAIEFAATVALQQILGNTVTENIHFGITVELDGELYETWVINTNRFNVSVYSGYEFNSYSVHNETAYGCKPNGIFKLSGATDDGSAFVPGIVLPETYFGTNRKKRFRKAFFGISGGTTPSIRVETDSGSTTYTISESKANITRDMYGRQWVLKVQDFDDLDFIELVAIILAR